MGFGTPDCAQFRAAISLRLLTAISLRSHPHLITGLLRHGVECSIKTPRRVCTQTCCCSCESHACLLCYTSINRYEYALGFIMQ